MLLKKKSKKEESLRDIYISIFKKMFSTCTDCQDIYYRYTMDCINYQIEHIKNADEQLALIDYYISAIITEISASYSTITIKPEYDRLTDSERNNFNVPRNWFPTRYYTTNNTNAQNPIIGRTTLKLQDVRLISLQTKPYAMANLLNHFKHGGNCVFQNTSIYIPYLNLCLTSNDSHKTAAAKYAGKDVEIDVQIYDLTSLFEYIETDGADWIYKERQSERDIVFDFRFAVIYSLAKRKYIIEHTN